MQQLNAYVQKFRTLAILLGTTLFGVLATAILLKNDELASLIYVSGVVLTMILIQPFVGILNYLVLIYIRPQDFIGIVQGMPLVFVMGAATFLFVIINTAFRRTHFVRTPQNMIVAWLFVAVIISHLGNAYVGGAIASAKEFLNLIFIYFLVVNLVTTETRVRIIMWLLCVLSLYLAVSGIYQGVTGVGLAGQTMIQGRIRGIGIFSDPNDLCLTFLMVMPFLLQRIIARKSLGEFAIATAMYGTFLTALYMTNSRGGMLAFAGATGAMFVRRFGKKWGVALAAFGLMGLFALGPSRMTDLSAKGESAYGRVEAWAAGLNMFKSSPLFGVGMNRFTEYHNLVAHNSFVHCAAELGIFGLLPWCLMIFVTMRNCYYVGANAGQQDRGIADLCDAVFFGFLGFMAALVFLSRVFNPLLFLLVGLGAAAVQVFLVRQTDKYVLMTKNDYLFVGFGAIVALMLLQVFLIVYY